MFGGMIFTFVEETWHYNRASEFCLMTLLTIGYGNTVPSTFHGRFTMIVYTTVGLFIAGFFIISAEDVIIQDTDNISLVKTDFNL
jgi:voltage-gated potassium channel Kch